MTLQGWVEDESALHTYPCFSTELQFVETSPLYYPWLDSPWTERRRQELWELLDGPDTEVDWRIVESVLE